MPRKSASRSVIEVLDPIGNVSYDSEKLSERPSKLDGLKIALVSRREEGGGTVGKLLEAVADSLSERLGVVGTVHVNPTPKRELAEPISGFTSSFEGRLANVKMMAAGAIVGAGVWGSTTPWCIHAAVELEKAGTPTVVFVVEAFASLARRTAIALSSPSLPIVVVPGPLRDDEDNPEAMHALVEPVVDDVIAALTASYGDIKGLFGKRTEEGERNLPPRSSTPI